VEADGSADKQSFMIGPEDPPGFVVCTEAQKAAGDNGYRLEHGAQGGWLRYGSTTALGSIAGASGLLVFS
jgi:hypothetical protein